MSKEKKLEATAFININQDNADSESDRIKDVPLELAPGLSIPDKYKDCPIKSVLIGAEYKRVMLIPATQDVYDAYMRPMWREGKRRGREAAKWAEAKEHESQKKALSVPLEENGYGGHCYSRSAEDIFFELHTNQVLWEAVSSLEDDINRQIVYYRYCLRYSMRQIADTLGFKSHTSIKKRLDNVILPALKTYLQDHLF